MQRIKPWLALLPLLISFSVGCGGSSSGPVEIAPITQSPTSDLPVGAEPELAEEGP